jgi:hypothetical protein
MAAAATHGSARAVIADYQRSVFDVADLAGEVFAHDTISIA